MAQPVNEGLGYLGPWNQATRTAWEKRAFIKGVFFKLTIKGPGMYGDEAKAVVYGPGYN